MHPAFDSLCLVVIFWNCIMLAINDPLSTDPDWQVAIDNFFLVFYTVEAVLKIWGLGFIIQRKAYLRDPWNVLDFVVVVTGYIPFVLNSNSVNLGALRTVRVLRPLRTISSIKSLRVVVNTLIYALPLLMNSLFILIFVLLIFAIAGLQLFSGVLKMRCFDPTDGRLFIDSFGNDMICGFRGCPSGYACGKTTFNPQNELTNFDTIANSFLVVFQIITLEGWSTVMYEVMKAFTPISVIYFLLLVYIGAYFLLNITLAVIKIIFSSISTGKGNKKELNYDQKRMKMFAKAKNEILAELRQFREERSLASSTKYFITVEGKLEKKIPNTEFYKKFGRKISSLAPVKKISSFMRSFTTKTHRNRLPLKVVGIRETEPEAENNNIRSGVESPRKDLLPLPNDPGIRVSTPVPFSERDNLLKEDHPSISTPKDGIVGPHRRISSPMGFSSNKVRPFPLNSQNELSLPIESPMLRRNKSSYEESKSNDREKPPLPIINIAAPIKETKETQELPYHIRPVRPKVLPPLKRGSSNEQHSIIGIAGINKTTNHNEESNIAAEFFKEAEGTNKSLQDLFEGGLLKKVSNPPGNLILPDIIDETDTNEKEFLKEDLDIKDEFTNKAGSLEADLKVPVQRKSRREGTGVSITGSFIDSILRWEQKSMTSKFGSRRVSAQRMSFIANSLQPLVAIAARNQPGGLKAAETKFFEDNLEEEDAEIDLDEFNREKYEFDIRFIKAMPNQKKNYFSQSLESVLPKVFQRERDLKIQQQFEKFGKNRPLMHYPILKDKKIGKNDEDPGSSFATTKSTAIPIRKKIRSTTFARKVSGHEKPNDSLSNLDQKTKGSVLDRSERRRRSVNNVSQAEPKASNLKDNRTDNPHRRQRSLRSKHASRKNSLQSQKSIEVSHNSKLNHEEGQQQEQESKPKNKSSKGPKVQQTLQTTVSEKTQSGFLKPNLQHELKMDYKEIRSKIREPVDESQRTLLQELDAFKFDEDYMKFRVTLQ